jgi:hypothetical protein
VLETDSMNPLELACVRGHAPIVTYFTQELNLRSKSDFNPGYKSLRVEQMPFVFVPIVSRDHAVFEILMNIPGLWSYEDLQTILLFIKQVKWREGLSIYLKSCSTHHMYGRLNIQQRFRLIQDSLNLPFRLECIPVDDD